MRERVTLPAGRHARLVYDCGTDEQEGGPELVLDERGMRFHSRWEFSLGTALAVNCTCNHPRLGMQQVRLEGFVVWSERLANPGHTRQLFDTTLLFLEVPGHLRDSLREISHRLTPAD